jgi:2-isopropylmalate synthase
MFRKRVGVQQTNREEMQMEKLILDVVARSATELIKHQHGPGTRFVFSDHKNNPEGSIYVIMRKVENVDNPEMHIEPHKHDFESLFIFKGDKPDMSGLVVEVLLGDAWHRIESPKTIRIPPGLNHNYRFIKGSGEYWNIVLTPGAEYNKTVK